MVVVSTIVLPVKVMADNILWHVAGMVENGGKRTCLKLATPTTTFLLQNR